MLPIMTFRTTGDVAVTTHDFGSVDAGSYKPDSGGWEVRIYNNYAAAGSDDATSVKINVRGSTGGSDEVWCEQHWAEVKSYGYSTGSTGMTDDAMTTFQPVGKDMPLGIGDISSTGYRTLFVRINSPTDAEEQNIALQLVCTYQNPQTAITKWITGLRGNGVVATTGEPFAMSTTGGTDPIPYTAGYALIDNNEIYYGSSGTYDITTTGSGTYTIYLNESGSFNETTGATAANELPLYEATISSGVCTALADKRVYLAGLQAGTTGAMPTTRDKGDLYLDLTNALLYVGKTSTGWSLISSNTFLGLTDTPADYSGDANKLLRVNTSSGAVEFSAVTVTSGGTVNIPTGQEYQINSANVKLDDWNTPDDNTDLNASTGYHGLLPKLSGNAYDVINGDGSWKTVEQIGNVTTTTGTHILAITEAGLIIASTTGTYTLTLPVSSGNSGLKYTILHSSTSSNLITLSPDSTGNLIGGSTGYTNLNYQYAYVIFESDNSDWLIIGESTIKGGTF